MPVFPRFPDNARGLRKPTLQLRKARCWPRKRKVSRLPAGPALSVSTCRRNRAKRTGDGLRAAVRVPLRHAPSTRTPGAAPPPFRSNPEIKANDAAWPTSVSVRPAWDGGDTPPLSAAFHTPRAVTRETVRAGSRKRADFPVHFPDAVHDVPGTGMKRPPSPGLLRACSRRALCGTPPNTSLPESTGSSHSMKVSGRGDAGGRRRGP